MRCFGVTDKRCCRECLFVQIDRDRRAGAVPLARSGHNHKAVSPGRRGKDRCAAQGERLDLVLHKSDTAIVHSSNGRYDLAGNGALARTVRPIWLPPTEYPDGAPGEELVGAKTRDRIAGKQEHQSIANAPCAGGARGPHGNPMNGELPHLSEEPWGVILAAHAGAPGYEDNVRTRRD